MVRRAMLTCIVLAVGIAVAAALVPGIDVTGGFWTYLWLGLLFGLVNAILGPILHIISLPLTVITLGLFALVVNGVLLATTAGLSDHLDVGGFLGTTVSLRNFIEDDMGINLWVFGIIPQNLMTFVGLVMLVVSVYAWALEPAVGPGEVHDDDPSYLATGTVGD